MIAPTDPRTPRVVLVGPPGAGKSTIGRKLAKELGVDLYDTDAGIERETGRTIPEIFAEDGEPEFRRIEERVVRRAVLAERGVVSLGGGAVLSANTRSLLRNRTVVYLEISVAEGLRRTGASNQRPLLNGDDPGAKYQELMRTRRPLYREVATVRVRTDGRSPSRVVRMILTRLGIDPGPADPEPGTSADTTQNPQGSSRSRARRRARARAAARRRATTAGSGVGQTTADESSALGHRPTSHDDSGTAVLPGAPAGAEAATATSANDTRGPGKNSGSDEGEHTAASRRRRSRRRRSRSGGRAPASNPQPGVGTVDTAAEHPLGEPRHSDDDRSAAGRSTSAVVPESAAGSRTAGAPVSAETGARSPGTDPRQSGAESPAEPTGSPGRNRRSGRRRGNGGSDRSRPDRAVAREVPDSTDAGDSPAATAQSGGPSPGGGRSRRARARRARNAGSGARGGASGSRGSALSSRGGVQNARGGATQQTARTESEQ